MRWYETNIRELEAENKRLREKLESVEYSSNIREMLDRTMQAIRGGER